MYAWLSSGERQKKTDCSVRCDKRLVEKAKVQETMTVGLDSGGRKLSVCRDKGLERVRNG